MEQLDIFLDTRATQLANAVSAALLAMDAESGRRGLAELRAEDPGYSDIPALETLCRFIGSPWQEAPVVEVVALLMDEIVPAAVVLGTRADRFLQPLWRDLARPAALLPFDPACPEIHGAALFLRAADYPGADEAASRVPDGENRPAVLRWLCLARHRLGGLDRALPMVLRFAWLAPDRLAALVGELGDPMLARAWCGFQAVLGDADATWFPAWFLHEHPAAVRSAGATPQQVPGALAHDVLLRLLELEKRGHSPALVSLRAELKALGETFFGFYMARRGAHRR